MPVPAPLPELDAALAEASIACANRAKEIAESGGHGTVAETWSAAAAQLAFAAKGVPAPLPARPGKG